MPMLRGSIAELSRILKNSIKKQSDEPTITVNDAVGVLAFYYEKIRNVIEYQDEHLLRQNAIRRILSRRRILSSDPKELAESLLLELVRSRYLPNNSIPIRTIPEVSSILSFYFNLESALKRESGKKLRDGEMLLSLASCAIDDHLSPMQSEEVLVMAMFTVVESLAESASSTIDETVRTHQLGIAVYRVLLRPDIMRLRYYLLKQTNPIWTVGAPDIEYARDEFVRLFAQIDASIRHPLNKKYLSVYDKLAEAKGSNFAAF